MFTVLLTTALMIDRCMLSNWFWCKIFSLITLVANVCRFGNYHLISGHITDKIEL